MPESVKRNNLQRSIKSELSGHQVEADRAILRNAFSLIAARGRCSGDEAELPAAYSFRNSGEGSAEWPQGGIGLKGFCKSDCGGIGSAKRGLMRTPASAFGADPPLLR